MQILGLGLRFHISVKLPGDANAAVHGALWGASPTKLQYCKDPRQVRAHEERGERFISDVCPGKEASGELAVECNTPTRCFLNHQNLTHSFTNLIS